LDQSQQGLYCGGKEGQKEKGGGATGNLKMGTKAFAKKLLEEKMKRGVRVRGKGGKRQAVTLDPRRVKYKSCEKGGARGGEGLKIVGWLLSAP